MFQLMATALGPRLFSNHSTRAAANSIVIPPNLANSCNSFSHSNSSITISDRKRTRTMSVTKKNRMNPTKDKPAAVIQIDDDSKAVANHGESFTSFQTLFFLQQKEIFSSIISYFYRSQCY